MHHIPGCSISYQSIQVFYMTRSSSSSVHNTELGYDSIRTVSSNQTISLNGRIKISKKGWVIRILTFAFLSLLIVVYNFLGLRNPQEEPIMMYTGFVISLSLFILTFGWIFYRNPSSSSSNNGASNICFY